MFLHFSSLAYNKYESIPYEISYLIRFDSRYTALIRIKDSYEAEIYTLAEFSERKKAQETLIDSIKAEIRELETTPHRELNLPPEELENRISEF